MLYRAFRRSLHNIQDCALNNWSLSEGVWTPTSNENWSSASDNIDSPVELTWEDSEALPGDSASCYQIERTVTAVLSELEPGTTYSYALVVDGEMTEPTHAQSVTTQPLWQYREDPPTFTAAMGSCLFINEAVYDRPEETWGIYGGEYEILDAIREDDPDVMLWLGDNTYFREVDYGSRAGMAYRYARDRRTVEPLARLLTSVANYATWDDHDYGENDAGKEYPKKEESKEIFLEFFDVGTFTTEKPPFPIERSVVRSLFGSLTESYFSAHPKKTAEGPFQGSSEEEFLRCWAIFQKE